MQSHDPPERQAPVPRTFRSIRVAVVDSGVRADHPHVNGVAGGVAVTATGLDDDYADRLGHGTAVAAAIREKAPHAQLFAVKVFDRTLSAGVAALVQAIELAVDHGCDLINLSLGTARLDHEARLRPAVERALSCGLSIVAAREDGGQRWLPGCLPGVIGVMVDWDCPRDRVRIDRAGDDFVVRASGYPRPIPGVPPSRNLMGVSFAVANVSGVLAAAMAGSWTPHHRLQDLV